ncbi:MAG: DUF2264 domain-containing protein, partial [Eubacteriales bacterium]|nr:DUF2264 domain-containing protein [Eubacteriales bacterium]
PFWTAEEKPYAAPILSLQPHARMLVARSANGDHVLAYTAGNHAHEHAHDEAKYEKFVYSTVFGFSVPKAGKLLKDGAFDSMLAVSQDGDTFHPRYGCETYEVTREKVTSVWSPFPNVSIRSEIIPLAENWHVRVHHLHCETKIFIAEGGFAIAREGAGILQKTADEQSASVCAPWGVSAIYTLAGYERGTVITPEPNTNLMSPRTELPTLTARLPAGEHTLLCAVYGSPDGSLAPILPQEVKRYANLG